MAANCCLWLQQCCLLADQLKVSASMLFNYSHWQNPSNYPSFIVTLLSFLPTLIHSSGNILPKQVLAHSILLHSSLIKQYVFSLIVALIDAHDLYTDGNTVGSTSAWGIPYIQKCMSKDTASFEDGEENYMPSLCHHSLKGIPIPPCLWNCCHCISLLAIAVMLDPDPKWTRRHSSNKIDATS